MRQLNEELSAREYEEYRQQVEMFEKQSAHTKEMKLLELEVMKIEARWNAWFKIPLMIIKLPVLCLLAVGFIVGSIHEDYEPGQSFWNLLK